MRPRGEDTNSSFRNQQAPGSFRHRLDLVLTYLALSSLSSHFISSHHLVSFFRSRSLILLSNHSVSFPNPNNTDPVLVPLSFLFQFQAFPMIPYIPTHNLHLLLTSTLNHTIRPILSPSLCSLSSPHCLSFAYASTSPLLVPSAVCPCWCCWSRTLPPEVFSFLVSRTSLRFSFLAASSFLSFLFFSFASICISSLYMSLLAIRELVRNNMRYDKTR